MLFIFTLGRITQLSFYVQRTASRKFKSISFGLDQIRQDTVWEILFKK